MIFPLTFVLLGIVMLTGCATSPTKDVYDGKTPSGYPYIIHHSTGSTGIQVGDRIRLSRQIRLGQDSVISPRTTVMILLPEMIQMPKPLPADYEMLLQMSIGDSVSVYVFGDELKAIPRSTRAETDTLIYDLTLIELLETKEQRESVMNKADEAEGRVSQAITGDKKGMLDNLLQTLPSGVKIMHISEGTGNYIAPGTAVDMHYCFGDQEGNILDNSFRSGLVYSFKTQNNELITGLEEVMSLLKKGSRALVIIPPHLAYGETGRPPKVKPNSTLYYFIDIRETY